MEVLDYQDSNLEALVHSCTAVIPSTLALAETERLPWSEIVPAIVAGYEIHTRLMLAIQPEHCYGGFSRAPELLVPAGRRLRLDGCSASMMRRWQPRSA